VTTEAITEFMNVDYLGYKQDAERRYENARKSLAEAQDALDAARAEVRDARKERGEARSKYAEHIKASRKPRQKDVVRRVLKALWDKPEGITRQDIIKMSELEAASVSTTLTRCKRAGFVTRDGDDFVGLWNITDSGRDWLHSNKPMPK